MPWPDIFFRTKPKSPLPLVPVPPIADLPVQPEAPVEAPPRAEESPVENVAQAMADADALRAVSKTGPVRLIRRGPKSPGGPGQPRGLESVGSKLVEPDPFVLPQTFAPGPIVPSPVEPSPGPDLVLPPNSVESPAFTPLPTPPTESATVGATPVRRRARLTEVARLILPPKRDLPLSAAQRQPAVLPPSFDIPVPVGGLLKAVGEETVTVGTPVIAPARPLPVPPVEPPRPVPVIPLVSSLDEAPVLERATDANEAVVPTEPEPAMAVAPPSEDKSPKVDETGLDLPASEPPSLAGSLAAIISDSGETTVPSLKVPMEIPPTSPALNLPPITRERREFHLINGERIFGTLLSETPEALYINHDTLGVLTVPTSQIAKRMIEVILINGDRVVGDIVAESAEALFIRHASLGVLTIPHAQRSTRVIEAILKDGDRILGEVLAETENFTVIRSATLGTVAVPHKQVALLNRKIEQIHLNSLASPGPLALEEKTKPAE